MDLTYSRDLLDLKDGAERFLRERYGKSSRESGARAEHDDAPANWRAFADLGWLAIPFAADVGGLALGALETAQVMEQFGRHLVIEPYVSSVVLCGRLIDRIGTEPQRREHVASIAAGNRRIAFAGAERGRPFAARPASTATAVDDGWLLTGSKMAVIDAPAADLLLTSAICANGDIGLFLVPMDAPAIAFQTFDTVDGRRAAHATLTDARIPHVARLGQGDVAAALEHALDAAIAAQSADLVGAMQAALDATVAYTKVREQFGQPLSANQVIRHRLVDMAVKVEEARSMSLAASIRIDDGSPAPLRGRVVSGAKVKVASAARFVCEQAVQLHGGMGVTDELDIGAYLKRAMAFEATFGTSAEHVRRYRQLGQRQA